VLVTVVVEVWVIVTVGGEPVLVGGAVVVVVVVVVDGQVTLKLAYGFHT
jgi:hypothetical protein